MRAEQRRQAERAARQATSIISCPCRRPWANHQLAACLPVCLLSVCPVRSYVHLRLRLHIHIHIHIHIYTFTTTTISTTTITTITTTAISPLASHRCVGCLRDPRLRLYKHSSAFSSLFLASPSCVARQLACDFVPGLRRHRPSPSPSPSPSPGRRRRCLLSRGPPRRSRLAPP